MNPDYLRAYLTASPAERRALLASISDKDTRADVLTAEALALLLGYWPGATTVIFTGGGAGSSGDTPPLELLGVSDPSGDYDGEPIRDQAEQDAFDQAENLLAQAVQLAWPDYIRAAGNDGFGTICEFDIADTAFGHLHPQ